MIDIARILPELNKYWKIAHLESDRAVYIIGAAKLKVLLRRILIKRLLPNRAEKLEPDPLFDNFGPIHSFTSRIEIANRIGLIHNKAADILHLIDEIRGGFSNGSESPKFKEANEKLTKHLARHFDSFPNFKYIVLKYFSKNCEAQRARVRAVLAMMFIYIVAIKATCTEIEFTYKTRWHQFF